MKKLLVCLLVSAAVGAAGSAQAGRHGQGFVDTAKVVDVEPIVRTVRVQTPRRECWDEEVRRPLSARHGDSAGSMIVGGLIGGVIGHELGRRVNKGRGRPAATIAGTLIGASIGHDQSSGRAEREHEYAYEQRCQTYTDHHTEERVDGYRVTYRYKGEEFVTRMPYDPGKRLRVRVRVSPIAD